MKTFNSILFVAEPGAGQDVLRKAVEFAENQQATLTLALVLEGAAGPWNASVEQAAQKWLDGLVGVADGRVPVTTKLLHGTAFLEIIREVIRAQYDLVIKPPKPGGALAQRLLGSADMHLLRKCPVPLWIMQSAEEKRPRRVLAAVDFGPAEATSLPDPALNRAIMETAAVVALANFAELHVCHVWDAFAEGMLRTWGSEASGPQVNEYVERERRWHEAQLKALLNDCEQWFGAETLEFARPNVHLRRGSAGEVIPALADELDVEVVVIGTIARSGVPGFFIGNTAETVMGRLRSSLLTIKPPGFVSPVEAG